MKRVAHGFHPAGINIDFMKDASLARRIQPRSFSEFMLQLKHALQMFIVRKAHHNHIAFLNSCAKYRLAVAKIRLSTLISN